jgi:heme oxygenase (biliverdin-IX-beta and delta-forming)
MISERLRAETSQHHEAIENAKRFSRLGCEDFSRSEYTELLEKFFGFYKPLEEALGQQEDILKSLTYHNRFKLPLLKKDLLYLGHTENSLDQIEVCADLPTLMTKAQVLGCIYVMEGSTHGSQFIAKRLKEQLALNGNGLAFYEGYGKDTMSMWKIFKSYLDESIDEQKEGNEVVSSAAQTFNALHRWMDQ